MTFHISYHQKCPGLDIFTQGGWKSRKPVLGTAHSFPLLAICFRDHLTTTPAGLKKISYVAQFFWRHSNRPHYYSPAEACPIPLTHLTEEVGGRLLGLGLHSSFFLLMTLTCWEAPIWASRLPLRGQHQASPSISARTATLYEEEAEGPRVCSLRLPGAIP